MEQIYDMEALYLYKENWNYRIGKIERINDKTIRMDSGTKITKEDFKNTYKLTDEETASFKKQTIKKLSTINGEIKNMINSINCLKSALQLSEFACVDSDKLQEKLDLLNEKLSEELPKVFEINDKKFQFEGHSTVRFSEVK